MPRLVGGVLHLEPEQHRLLKKEAEARGISLVELLRQVVWEHLRVEPSHKDFYSLVALGKSGKSDVSEEHDRYIAEGMADVEDLR